MRRICLLAFVATVLVAATSAHAFEASCDFRKCMTICRSEYESGCTGMCGRIISLCRQLVLKPERTRSARHANSAHKHIKLDARAGNSLRLIH